MTSSTNKHDADCQSRKEKWDFRHLCTCGMTDDEVKDAICKRMKADLEALPPRKQAELLGITGPYDADLCPVCFDQDSTGCPSCGGTGRRADA